MDRGQKQDSSAALLHAQCNFLRKAKTAEEVDIKDLPEIVFIQLEEWHSFENIPPAEAEENVHTGRNVLDLVA